MGIDPEHVSTGRCVEVGRAYRLATLDRREHVDHLDPLAGSDVLKAIRPPLLA